MSKRSERGIALFEGSLWLAALLPLGLVCASVGAVVHDQAALRVAPEAALREISGGSLRWISDGFGGRYEADLPELRAIVARVSENALHGAQKDTFKTENISTKACFWIFSVNSSNGKLISPIHSECDGRGPRSRDISLEDYVSEEKPKRLGVPRGDSGQWAGYVDRVVLLGVAVVGDLPNLLEPSSTYRISYGAISYPRQEISL